MALDFENIFEAVSKKDPAPFNEEYDFRTLVDKILTSNKITNQTELDTALIRAGEIWDALLKSAEGDELDQLADLISDYEHQKFMGKNK
ncbi:hypothetical protein NBRC116592_04000 [Colwellia sp. KU-HH00111]|uniref:hypothetical protein n=1 Tax=Colwellia sp. KU-HH00111 TaxID=3127652 RepID=UPI00310B0EE1